MREGVRECVREGVCVRGVVMLIALRGGIGEDGSVAAYANVQH